MKKKCFKRFFQTLAVLGLILGFSISESSAQTVKIGVIQPLSGGAAHEGMLVVSGIKMAVEEINKKGGVLGKPIELFIEDGKAAPLESVNVAEKLITQNGVCGLIGAWSSSATLAVMPIVEKYRVPLVIETGSAHEITLKGNLWTFRTTYSDKIMADNLAPYLVKDIGIKKIGFILWNNDWGRGSLRVISDVVKKHGQDIGPAEFVSPVDTDFYTILERIKGAGCNTVGIALTIPGIATILKQHYEKGLKMERLIPTGFPVEPMLKLAGKEAIEGIYFYDSFFPFAPTPGLGAKHKDFVERYAKNNPDKPLPDAYVVRGYDALQVLAQAIEKAGSDDREKIKEALKNVNYTGLTGNLRFDENRQAYPNTVLSQIKDGKPRVVRIVSPATK